MTELGQVAIVVLIAGVAGTIGIALGIFVLAPRLSRMADHLDEEPSDGDD